MSFSPYQPPLDAPVRTRRGHAAAYDAQLEQAREPVHVHIHHAAPPPPPEERSRAPVYGELTTERDIDDLSDAKSYRAIGQLVVTKFYGRNDLKGRARQVLDRVLRNAHRSGNHSVHNIADRVRGLVKSPPSLEVLGELALNKHLYTEHGATFDDLFGQSVVHDEIDSAIVNCVRRVTKR